jgi:hypothetical protein
VSSKDPKTSVAGEHEKKPPMLVSWRRLYTVVIAELAVLILLFYLFTKAFE